MSTHNGSTVLASVVFATVLLVASQVLQSLGELPRDESWLIAAAIGVFIINSLPPLTRNFRVRWVGVELLIVLGAYAFWLKFPELLTGFMAERLATGLCFVAYLGGCLFLILRLCTRHGPATGPSGAADSSRARQDD